MKIDKVHSDDRRDIYSVDLLEDSEFTFIKIKKGKAIGGCIHKHDEYFTVIKGLAVGFLGQRQKVYTTGESGFIPKGWPHAFWCKTESIICEWGVPASEKFEYNYEMREMVNEINND